MATNTIAQPVTRGSAPYMAVMNNGSSASTMLVKTELSTIGSSFIITVNRRGSYHSVMQAVVGLITGNVDLEMTAGTGLTATLATNGFTVALPSYSRVMVIGSQPFTLSGV